MKSSPRFILIALTVLVAAGVLWLARRSPSPGSPVLAAHPAPAPRSPLAAAPVPLATSAATSPAPIPSPATPALRPPRAFVFGDNGPVTLADIPPGRFRDELLGLSDAARTRALTALATLRIPLNNLASLHVDPAGDLYYACLQLDPALDASDSLPLSPVPTVARSALAPSSTAPTAAAAELFTVSVPTNLPPARHSNPGSTRVIYLDFNGHTVTGTSWNSTAGAPASFLCTAFDLDGNSGSFNPAEQTAIVEIWERVAESFRAFDVDVTTEEPAVFNNQTARALITKARDANGVANPSSATASGVAYLNTFGNSNFATATAICFIYADGETAARISAIASHELGHQMGLSHDGTASAEYYSGHGTGDISWGPVMGNSGRNVVQWSKGEYFDANNTQDDLALITAKLTARTGDLPGTDAAATALVANGSTLAQRNQFETTTDTDTFSFTTAGGALALTIGPVPTTALANKNSVDVAAELRDSAGNLVTRADPADSPTVSFAQTLAAGTYTLRLTPAGTGTPLANPPSGYTAYGSIGTYEITGTVPPPAAPVAAAVTQDPASQSAFPGNAVPFTVLARGNPATTYLWQRSTDNGGSWFTLAESATYVGTTTATLTVAALTTGMNGDRFRAVVTNSAGTATSVSATVTVATPPAPTLPAFEPFPIVSSFGRAIPAGTSQNLTATLTAGSDPLALKWQLDGVDIPGAEGPVYYRQNWQPADAGRYRVVATNPAGTVTSAAFTQFVTPEAGWQWRNPLPTGNGLTRVSFVNGRFFIGGLRGTILTSTDGLAWTLRPIPAANNVFSFHYHNNLFIALASLGAVFTSPDAVTWTPRNSGVVVRDTGSGLQDMVLGDGRLVAVGLGGLTSTSTDGLTWTPGSAGTTEDLTGVAHAFGRFHAVSSESGRIFSSTDGVNWTSLITPTSGMRRIAFGAGRLVAVGTSGGTLVSTDGTTWTPGIISSSAIALGINYLNGQFVAVGTSGSIYTSADGLAWITRNSGGNSSNLQNATYGNGRYVIVGQSGTTGRALLTSTDGITWSETIAGVGAVGTTLRGLTAGNGSLIAVGNSGTILQSANGTTWTPRSSNTSVQLNDVGFGAGRFVAVGASGAIATSTDGASWSVQTAPAVATLNGVRFDNDLWVITAAAGRIFISANGTTWNQRFSSGTSAFNKSAYGNGRYVAIGAAGIIATSTDGTTWTAGTALTTETLNDVTYAAGLFVAIGTGGTVRTSTDGLTWTDRSFSNDALTSITYTAGHFIVTGPGSTYYVSTDGLTWTGRFTGTNEVLYDSATLGSEVFFVGDNSVILAAGTPVITAPDSSTVTAGAATTLRATVAASAFPLTYQWFKDGVAVSGATTPVLSLATTSTTDAGSYTLRATGPTGTVTSAATLLTVNPVSTGLTSRLSNLSVLTTLAANQVLTVGFTMSGGSKPILLRAAGPGLGALGVPGTMADPKLALFNGTVSAATNENWAGDPAIAAANIAVGAFPFPSATSLDAALVTSIDGGRTAQVSGPAAGTVIVEAYDAGTGLTPRLTNLSALNFVSPTNLLIAGFTLAGTGPKTVLIRAVGPGLTTLGVGGALANPKLELFNSSSVKIAENDTWSPSLAATFATVGAFALPAGSLDAALVVTLNPGGYTVQVSGVAGATGSALIELYELP